MLWSLCANSEAVTNELEYVQQLDPDNFLKYLHASDIEFPSDIADSHCGLSIDDFCSRATSGKCKSTYLALMCLETFFKSLLRQ